VSENVKESEDVKTVSEKGRRGMERRKRGSGHSAVCASRSVGKEGTTRSCKRRKESLPLF